MQNNNINNVPYNLANDIDNGVFVYDTNWQYNSMLNFKNGWYMIVVD